MLTFQFAIVWFLVDKQKSMFCSDHEVFKAVIGQFDSIPLTHSIAITYEL